MKKSRTVKIVMCDGEIIILKNCIDYCWVNETNMISVCKKNTNHIIFNSQFVKYIGFLEDLEEGEENE